LRLLTLETILALKNTPPLYDSLRLCCTHCPVCCFFFAVALLIARTRKIDCCIRRARFFYVALLYLFTRVFTQNVRINAPRSKASSPQPTSNFQQQHFLHLFDSFGNLMQIEKQNKMTTLGKTYKISAGRINWR